MISTFVYIEFIICLICIFVNWIGGRLFSEIFHNHSLIILFTFHHNFGIIVYVIKYNIKIGLRLILDQIKEWLYFYFFYS